MDIVSLLERILLLIKSLWTFLQWYLWCTVNHGKNICWKLTWHGVGLRVLQIVREFHSGHPDYHYCNYYLDCYFCCYHRMVQTRNWTYNTLYKYLLNCDLFMWVCFNNWLKFASSFIKECWISFHAVCLSGHSAHIKIAENFNSLYLVASWLAFAWIIQLCLSKHLYMFHFFCTTSVLSLWLCDVICTAIQPGVWLYWLGVASGEGKAVA